MGQGSMGWQASAPVVKAPPSAPEGARPKEHQRVRGQRQQKAPNLKWTGKS